MVENTSLKLCNLLATPLTEVDSIEKRIQKVLRNKNDNDDDEDDDLVFIERKMEQLINRHYDNLKLIDRTKRIEFWKELNIQLQQLPRLYGTKEIQSQMSLLQMICHFEFTQKPLSFVFEGIHDMDILNDYEQQLLALIEKLRNKYGLTNILNTQYEAIRNKRRKIVLGIAGALKSGKSSFANYLLESDVCPKGIIETTARLTKITYGEQKLVKLESITGELREPPYEIQTNEQLKEVTKKLIALEGDARKGELCKDIVTIQLDRKELENIELWDIPGFDENSLLNSLVEDILKETDILFFLTSTTEGVRETIVNLLRSCYEKHKHQPQVCFIVAKIDQVTMNLEADTTLENTLEHVFRRVQDAFQMKLEGDWISSPFFIPLCTHPRYNLKDFLLSHEQFTRKLTEFFTHGTRHNMLCRLQYLIETIHELFDCDDLDRNIQRDERLSKMLAVYQVEFQAEMKRKLEEVFIRIHQVVVDKISTTIQLGNDDVIRQTLDNEIKQELRANYKEIERNVSKCLNRFYSKLEENPALTGVIWSFGKRNLYGDPYSTIIGQYKNGVDNLISSVKSYHTRRSLSSVDEFFFSRSSTILSYLNKISPAVVSIIDSWASKIGIFPKVGDFIREKRQWKMLEMGAQVDIKSSVQTILNGLIKDISNHIHQILSKQLNSISENIRRRKETLSKQIERSGVQHIAEILREDHSAVVQLYLSLLDKMHRLEYPWYEINSENVLDHSNFRVFAGTLGSADRTYSEEITAKCVPLDNFTWQEICYMNELKHVNILRYYGVRKSEHLENHYDILTQQFDLNLTQYIDDVSKEGRINGKLINDIFLQVVHGVAYLHEQDLIHRDIKPENVLVQFRKKQPPVFILAAFGFLDRVPISVRGTTGFLAPELLTNNSDNIFITATVDIYALGITIQKILEKSPMDKEDRYVKFWAEISQRCCLSNSFQRPTCQNILERHSKTR